MLKLELLAPTIAPVIPGASAGTVAGAGDDGNTFEDEAEIVDAYSTFFRALKMCYTYKSLMAKKKQIVTI